MFATPRTRRSEGLRSDGLDNQGLSKKEMHSSVIDELSSTVPVQEGPQFIVREPDDTVHGSRETATYGPVSQGNDGESNGVRWREAAKDFALLGGSIPPGCQSFVLMDGSQRPTAGGDGASLAHRSRLPRDCAFCRPPKVSVLQRNPTTSTAPRVSPSFSSPAAEDSIPARRPRLLPAVFRPPAFSRRHSSRIAAQAQLPRCTSIDLC